MGNVRASVVFDQEGMPTEVAHRGARHLDLQPYFLVSLDDVGSDPNRTRRLERILRHPLEPSDYVVPSLAAFEPAM